jgi:deoxycytidylate deaminase
VYQLNKLLGNKEYSPIYSRYLELAHSEAWKSNFRMKMSCILIRGGTLLSTGHNYIQQSTKAYWNCSFHAEVDAILNCRTVTKNAKALVYRFNRQEDVLSPSQPCSLCEEYLRRAQIKSVICVSPNYELIRISL